MYDPDGGVDGIVAAVDRDLRVLLAHDFDAVMFCNEAIDRTLCTWASRVWPS